MSPALAGGPFTAQTPGSLTSYFCKPAMLNPLNLLPKEPEKMYSKLVHFMQLNMSESYQEAKTFLEFHFQ